MVSREHILEKTKCKNMGNKLGNRTGNRVVSGNRIKKNSGNKSNKKFLFVSNFVAEVKLDISRINVLLETMETKIIYRVIFI